MKELKGLRKQLEIVGVESINYLRRILVEDDKRATGKLIASLDFKIIKDVNGLMLQLLSEPYLTYIDEGRKPGRMPPVKAIQSWVQAKGIIVKNQSLSQTAFMIARSIERKGIKPLNIKQGLINNIIMKKTELLKKGAIEDIEQTLLKTFYSDIKKEFQ